MRSLFLVAATAFAIATAAAPATAGVHAANLKLWNPSGHHFPLCIAPAQLENECVAWGPAGSGQLFGPCLKYQLQCVTPANIQ